MKRQSLNLLSLASAPRELEVALGRRMAAEILGTAALTFAACSIEILSKLFPGEFSLATRAGAPAMIIVASIYGLGKISGAHLNPAVTLAFATRRDFPWKLVPAYITAEVIGAVIASAIAMGFFGSAVEEGLSQPVSELWRAFAAEVVLTFLLVFVILSTATQHRILGPSAALPVGLTIAGCGLLGLKLSGPSMNPARSLGPAIVCGNYADLWIYLMGPVVGSLLAAGCFSFLKGNSREEKEAACGEGH